MLEIQRKICLRVNNLFCHRSLKKKCRVYNFLYELSIAAHFFIVICPAFKKIRLYIFVTNLNLLHNFYRISHRHRRRISTIDHMIRIESSEHKLILVTTDIFHYISVKTVQVLYFFKA